MQNIQRVLREFGLDFEHLVKINTFYVGSKGEKDLTRNVSIRAGYYRDPGPASTGIPFPYLAYKDLLIEIDCVAMVWPDLAHSCRPATDPVTAVARGISAVRPRTAAFPLFSAAFWGTTAVLGH